MGLKEDGALRVMWWLHLVVALAGKFCPIDASVPWQGSRSYDMFAIVCAVPLAIHADVGVLLKDADAAFSRGEYNMAIRHYTTAIELDPKASILYTKRAAAYMSSRQASQALRDLNHAIEHDNSFVQGFIHRRVVVVALAPDGMGAHGHGHMGIMGHHGATRANGSCYMAAALMLSALRFGKLCRYWTGGAGASCTGRCATPPWHTGTS